MGQKVHPFGFRVGITEAHKSRWYAPKALYGELLVEDFKIREFLDKELPRALKQLFTFLDAAIILTLGGLIAISALSLLLPIFQLRSNMGQ